MLLIWHTVVSEKCRALHDDSKYLRNVNAETNRVTRVSVTVVLAYFNIYKFTRITRIEHLKYLYMLLALLSRHGIY